MAELIHPFLQKSSVPLMMEVAISGRHRRYYVPRNTLIYIKCRFGTSNVVDAVMVNEFEAICMTPSSPLSGTVIVYLSTDRGQTYRPF
ncbi:unnamed protein product [Rotaria magnacalcarata]|uniref:Uncharacterized protein n=1 Tax=Rotaria magnacalcarata TaxID=392030 RepID=A0A8S2QV88_9BILA|nr:unnamed protein product [Rotaria magnacalcarata]